MRVWFLCTANICRSPLAEHLFREAMSRHGIEGVSSESAGLFAHEGTPASEGMVAAAAARGVDLSGHRARLVAPQSIGVSDLVFVMEERQRLQLLTRAKLDPRSVRLLGRFAAAYPEEVADPMGGSRAAYDACVRHIDASIQRLASWLEDEKISRS